MHFSSGQNKAPKNAAAYYIIQYDPLRAYSHTTKVDMPMFHMQSIFNK